jgi:multidrug efflux pump subunit AcrA (membrane-fusion protein)
MEKEQSPGYESLIYKPTKVSWALHSVVMRKEGQLDRYFFYFLVLSILSFIVYGYIAMKAIVVDTEGTIINSSNPQPVSSELSIKVGKILIKDNQNVRKGETVFLSNGYLEPADFTLVTNRVNGLISNINTNKTTSFSKIIEIENANQTTILSGLKASVDDQLLNEATRLQNLVNRYILAVRGVLNLPSLTSSLVYRIATTKNKIAEIEKRNAVNMLSTEYEELKSQLVELQANLNDRKVSTERELSGSESELLVELNSYQQKISKKNDSLIFKALTDGVIRYSALATEGQIINPGNIIYYIVQSESEYVAELKIQNRDISKIKKDQEVKLDIEAFPANEYGIQSGQVLEIQQKVVKKEENSNAREFVAIVKLENQFIKQGDKKIYGLRNGMALKAKVVTKYEKMISYLVKKLLKIKDEYIGN